MRVETKVEIQTREVEINTYISDDGEEFNDAKQCEKYELEAAREHLGQQLERIETCKEAEDYCPVDGGEYYEQHDYKWYLPKNQNEAEVINEYYKLEYGITADEIGKWVCIEAYNHSDPTEGTYAMSITESIKYVEKLFTALGYNVSINKRSE